MRFALLLAMVAGLVGAQEKAQAPKPDKSSYETAIIPVKTLTGDSFQRLAGMLNIFGEKYAADEKLRTIVVYAPREVIAHMRKVVEAMDRPGSEAAIGRNIQMTMTLLRCSSKPAESSGALPADMESVAKQLRSVSLCKDVQLWDVVPLHLTEGKPTENHSRLPGNMWNMPSAFASLTTRVAVETVRLKPDGRYVKFDQIRVNIRAPYLTSKEPSVQWQYQEHFITTAGEFKEGQKSVVGKMAGAEENSAIFIVIELKVLD